MPSHIAYSIIDLTKIKQRNELVQHGHDLTKISEWINEMWPQMNMLWKQTLISWPLCLFIFVACQARTFFDEIICILVFPN